MIRRLCFGLGAMAIIVALGSCVPRYDLWLLRGSTASALRFAMAQDRDRLFGDPWPVDLQSFQVTSCERNGAVVWRTEYRPDAALVVRGEWSQRTPLRLAAVETLAYGDLPSLHYIHRVGPSPLVAGCYVASLESDPGTGSVEFIIRPDGSILPRVIGADIY